MRRSLAFIALALLGTTQAFWTTGCPSEAPGTVELYGACRVHNDCLSGLCAGGEDPESTLQLDSPFCSIACSNDDDCDQGYCFGGYSIGPICLASEVTHACVLDRPNNDEAFESRYKCINQYAETESCDGYANDYTNVTTEPGKSCADLGYTVYCSGGSYYKPGTAVPSSCSSSSGAGGGSSGGQCQQCLSSCSGLSGCCCGEGCLCDSECTDTCNDA